MMESSDQQQAVNTESVVGGYGEKVKEKHPGLFGNNISVSIYSVLQGYRPSSGSDGILKESIIQLASLNIWDPLCLNA